MKNIFSVDPGYKTSGFTHISLDSNKILSVEMWSSTVKDLKIMGISIPELFKIARNRAYFFVSQMEHINSKGLCVILEYTSLNQQFSTSLNILVAIYLSILVEKELCSEIILVPPKTSHWIVNKKRKVKISELKEKVRDLFPEIDSWVKSDYKLNSHSMDSFLLATSCFSEIFLENGYDFIQPKIENEIIYLD